MADLLKDFANGLPLPGKKASAPTDPSLTEAEKIARGMVSVRDILAPGAIEVDFTYLHVGNVYYRTLFVAGYPRQVGANWLSPLINFSTSLDISMFYYPMNTKTVLKKLRRKITEMEASLMSQQEAGKLASPETELNLEDATHLQDELVEGSEKFFQFSLYITIPAHSLEELNSTTKQLENILGGMMILTKPATLQMPEGFKSSLPTGENALGVMRNMDTTSLATTFPFTSSELTSNEGVMYGLNEHNGSLVVFDRFNLENANMTIFAKSGAGKSYAVKLEAMRSLMLGIEVIVIDPENEYKKMAEAIGGSYIPFDFNSPSHINPFDLSAVYEEGENELGLKILNLHGLIKVMFGDLSPTEEAVVDRALVLTYKLKGITPDPDTQKNEPPLLEDLYKVFLGMEEPEASGLADRLERYVKGSAAGLFDKPSNVDLSNTFTVFGVRDLEDAVRPIAMYVILDYIWTNIRKSRKKRILVVDEAWFLMQNPDSAKFLFSLAKRARKYFLGLTTITQDVEDFIATDLGKAIVTNSSLQFLMKQSTSSVDKLAEVFYLSSGEKNLLLSSNIGEGLFFAGPAHVALQVIASPDEHRLITTNPKELNTMDEQDSSQAQKIDQMLKEQAAGTLADASIASIQPTPAAPQAPQTPLTNSNQANIVDPSTSSIKQPTATQTTSLPTAGNIDPTMANRDTRVGSPDLPLPTTVPVTSIEPTPTAPAESVVKPSPTTPAINLTATPLPPTPPNNSGMINVFEASQASTTTEGQADNSGQPTFVQPNPSAAAPASPAPQSRKPLTFVQPNEQGS